MLKGLNLVAFDLTSLFAYTQLNRHQMNLPCCTRIQQ